MRGLCPRAPGIYRFGTGILRMGRRISPLRFQPLDGAPVAFLRSRILHPGSTSIRRLCPVRRSFLLPVLRQWGITTVVLPLACWPVLRCPRLAGFEVSPEALDPAI
jgi:hypothetical protein